MKLKKLISIAGTLAIVLSMITIPVKADVVYSWHMDETALRDSEGERIKVVNALGGKESGTVYQFTKRGTYIRLNASLYEATGSFTDASYCLAYPKTNGYDADTSKTMQSYEGYMIVSFNIYPTSYTQQFRLTRRGGGYVSGVTTTSEANGFVLNQWNKVDIFVRLSATGGNGGNRYAGTYVNGQYVWRTSGNSYHSLFSLTSGQDEDLRFGVADADDRAGFYIDDLYVAFTTETPAIADIPTAFSSVLAMPTLSGVAGATVDGSTINLSGNVTLSALDGANTNTVTAYTDNTFTTPLASGDTLVDGNIVISTDSLGKMSYYSVNGTYVPDTHWALDNSDIVTTSNITVADGVGGKAASDDVLYYACGNTEYYRSLTAYHIETSGALTTPISDMTTYTGYVIIQMNIMSPVETAEFAITTNQGNIVVGTSGGGYISIDKDNGFVKDRWNHVVSVLRLANGSTTELRTTYVNGVQISQRAHNLYSSGKTDVRLNARKGDVYFDDVTIDFTTSAQNTAVYLTMPTAPTLKKGMTVAEAEALGATRMYSSDVLTSADLVADKNAVIDYNYTAVTEITDGYGSVKYAYNTLVKKTDLEWTLDNSGVIQTSIITVVTGAGAGKDANDDVLKYSGATEGYIRLNTAYNISADKSLQTPLSDMTEYTGYMIYSMNIMSDNEKKNFAITTNSGDIVCGTNAGGYISMNEASFFNKNKWNRVVSIIRLNNGATTSLQTTYVNGNKLSERVHPLFSSGKTDVRLNARGDGNAYIDDVTVLFTQYEPDMEQLLRFPVLTSDCDGKISVSSDEVTVYKTTTAGELNADQGTTVKVFDSPTFDYLLEENSQLYEGNVIVVTDSDNKMSYYSVREQIKNKATITSYQGTVTAKAFLEDSVMILALYDADSKLINLEYTNKNGEAVLTLDDDFECAKVFILESLLTLKPISDMVVYKKTPIVACWGDSLTYGQASSDVNTKSFPAVLKNLTGYDVYNTGVGGETAMTIAAKQGGVNILIDEGFVIPSDTSEVEISFSAYNEDGSYAGVVTPRATNVGYWNPCTINGVEGTLTVSVNNSVWPRVLNWAKFKRNEIGEAVEVSIGTPVVTQALQIAESADINIIYIGENGGWNSSNTTKNDNDADDLVILINKMLAKTKNPDKYIVIGLQNGSQPKTDSALLNAYGEHTILPKTYLATEQVLIDSGITPTSDDLSAIANGKIPPSILAQDGVHMTDAGYAALARMVYEKMQELGYVQGDSPALASVSLLKQCSEADDFEEIKASRAKTTVEYGVGGKNDSDAVGKFTVSGTDDGSKSFFYYCTAEPDYTKRKMTATVSVFMNETISKLMFATNSHAKITDSITASQLNDGEWNNISLVYDPTLESTDLYINDEFVSTREKKLGDSFRIVFYVGAADFYDGYIYFDDMNIISGEVKYPIADFHDYYKNGIYLSGYGEGTTAKEFSDNITFTNKGSYLEIFDKSGKKIGDNDIVKKGYEVKVMCGDAPIGHYYTGVADIEVEDVYTVTNGYKNSLNKFTDGIVDTAADIAAPGKAANIKATAKLYSVDNTLIKTETTEKTISGKDSIVVPVNVGDSDGKYIKFTVENADTHKTIGEEKTFTAYSKSVIEESAPLYEGFTTKAAVFSYDDCTVQDAQLINIFNSYGVKGTFNLTANYIYNRLKASCLNETGRDDSEAVYTYAKQLYSGHEISTHTMNHYPAGLNPGEQSTDSNGITLIGKSTAEEISDIVGCPEFLRENLDAENVIGLAWPNGYGTNRTDYESDLLPAMKNAGLKYARASANGTFDLPVDWYKWYATCHHNDAVFYADKFTALKNEGELKCFFCWGHAYELENSDNTKNFTMIENVIKTLSNDNVWFAGNGDVYRYKEALDKVVITNTAVTNNSDITLYYQINGENIEILPGETYNL